MIGLMVAITLVVAVLAWLRLSKNPERDAPWRRFASARQLSFGDGEIAGVAGGFTVALLREDRGGSETVRTFTLVRCSLGGALPHDFTLERETLGDKLSQLVSGADHQLGHPEMDWAFLLDRVDEHARAVLSDRTAQERLLAMVQRYPGMRIGKGVLQLEVERDVTDEDGLARMLSDALSLATALHRAKQRPG